MMERIELDPTLSFHPIGFGIPCAAAALYAFRALAYLRTKAFLSLVISGVLTYLFPLTHEAGVSVIVSSNGI
jgi:hypothetical protein